MPKAKDPPLRSQKPPLTQMQKIAVAGEVALVGHAAAARIGDHEFVIVARDPAALAYLWPRILPAASPIEFESVKDVAVTPRRTFDRLTQPKEKA